MTRIAAETATAEPPAIQTITRLAQVLDTGLDQKAIESIVALLENGVHPDALAALIIEIRRAGSAGTIGKWTRAASIKYLIILSTGFI